MLEFLYSTSLSFFEIIRLMLALACFTAAVSWGWMLGKDAYCAFDEARQSRKARRQARRSGEPDMETEP